MSSLNIKINMKKLEKSINNQIESIIQKKQKELILKGSNKSMNVLSIKEENLLEIILSKYDGNENMEVNGTYKEIPSNMHLGIETIFRTLKLYNYIGHYDTWLNGWSVVLNQEGIYYFEKKGMRKELFYELADNEKLLLKEIIETENADGNISKLLAQKVDEDKKDIVRGIIGSLKTNGLLNVNWASNTVANAFLTQAGRTYFEREEKYFKRMKGISGNTYNFGNVNVEGGNFVAGNVINSTLNVDNHVNKIEKQINEKASEEDKETLKEILEDAKEIIDNIKTNGVVEKRKSFFKKLTEHSNKYGWFYAEVVNLIGTAVLTKISG